MFYRKDEDGDWNIAIKVTLTDGAIIDSENRENDFGWKWHDNPPKEYLDWEGEQEIDFEP